MGSFILPTVIYYCNSLSSSLFFEMENRKWVKGIALKRYLAPKKEGLAGFGLHLNSLFGIKDRIDLLNPHGGFRTASIFCAQTSLFSRKVDFHLISLFSALCLTSIFHDVWCYRIQSLSGSVSVNSKPLVSFGRKCGELAAQGRGVGHKGLSRETLNQSHCLLCCATSLSSVVPGASKTCHFLCSAG